jgi:hypothetical protein
MPAILTHHLFGEEILKQLGPDAFPMTDEYDAFLLGNQGPDPFFYPLLTTQPVAIREFASKLHRQRINAALDTMRAYARDLHEPEQRIVDAYLCGYLCHFALDSIAHPFVFAQQYAICDAGVPGLTRADGGCVHSQIEADLDSMMLYLLRSQTIWSYKVPKLTLQASGDVLAAIDGLYVQVARTVYDSKLPAHAFSGAVRDMRLSVRALYSPRGIKRRLLGFGERLFNLHSRAQATSHRSDVFETCDYDNRNAQIWVDPATGELSVDSFVDLFNAAQQAALEDLRLHEEGADSALITGNLSFVGIPADPPLSKTALMP